MPRRIREAAEKASSALPVGGRFVEIGKDDWSHSASGTERELEQKRRGGTMDR